MAKRRGHGEGSIYQRKDGRWAAAVDLGWTDGKRKRKTVYGKTQGEVVAEMRVLQRQQATGTVPDDRITVAEFLIDFLAGKKGTIRPGTYTRYEQLIRLHLIPGLGRKRLARLSPKDLQRFYSGRIDAGCAPRSVVHMHRLMSTALKQAAAWGLVVQNVASLVSPPRPPKKAMRALTAEQANALLKASEDHRLAALVVLAVHTGMRKGELLGLRWCDVDMDEGAIHVQGSLQPIPGEGLQVVEVKTEKSRRKIQLGQASVQALRRHRARQGEERLRRGNVWADLDLVFTNEVGRPIHPSNFLQRDFRPLVAKAKLPPMKFHDLRDTCATLLLVRGVHPKIVSEMLGHSDITVTLNIYSHVLPTMQQQAIDTLDDLLGDSLAVKLAVNEDPE